MKMPTKEEMKDVLYASMFVGVICFVLYTTFNFAVQVLRDADVLYTVEEMEANRLNPPRSEREILIDIEERLKVLQELYVPNGGDNADN